MFSGHLLYHPLLVTIPDAGPERLVLLAHGLAPQSVRERIGVAPVGGGAGGGAVRAEEPESLSSPRTYARPRMKPGEANASPRSLL